MIKLVKKSKRSLHIELDKTGAGTLISYLSGNPINVNIVHNEVEKNFTILVKEEANEVIVNNEFINLELDNDEKDYFLQRLCSCVHKNSFYPAELCERDMKNKTVSIYVTYLDAQ